MKIGMVAKVLFYLGIAVSLMVIFLNVDEFGGWWNVGLDILLVVFFIYLFEKS